MALSHRHMRPNTDISAYDLVRQSIRARLRLQTQTCDVQAFAIWKQPGRAPYASTGCPTTWDYALQNDKVPLRLASRCNHQPGSGLCGHMGPLAPGRAMALQQIWQASWLPRALAMASTLPLSALEAIHVCACCMARSQVLAPCLCVGIGAQPR